MIKVKKSKIIYYLLFLSLCFLIASPPPAEAVDRYYIVHERMNEDEVFYKEIPPGMRLKKVIFHQNFRFKDSSERDLRIHVDNNAWHQYYIYTNNGDVTVTIPSGYGYTNFEIYHNIYSYEVDVDFTYVYEPTTAQESTVIEAKNASNAAKTSADNAKVSADTAAARSYYNGNTSGYWSYNAYSKANSASSNTTYIRNTQLPSIDTKITSAKSSSDAAKASADLAASRTIYNGKSAAEWAYIASTYANQDNAPPILECSWKNGATITDSSRRATLCVTASDNVSSPNNITLEYSLDGSNYTTISGNEVTITFPSSPKYATVYVRATDEAGKQTVKTLKIFVQ